MRGWRASWRWWVAWVASDLKDELARGRVDLAPPAPARPAPHGHRDAGARVPWTRCDLTCESHGGNVQFLGIDGGVARVRLEGSCDGCPSSTMTLKLAIEEAIQKAAPGTRRRRGRGRGRAPSQPQMTIVAGPNAGQEEEATRRRTAPLPGRSVDAPTSPAAKLLLRGGLGEPVLFLKVGEELLAYRDLCPGCGGSLESGLWKG